MILTEAVAMNALFLVMSLAPRYDTGLTGRPMPGDGLQAACLLRRKPLPPPPVRPARAPATSFLNQRLQPVAIVTILAAVALEFLGLAHLITEPVAVSGFVGLCFVGVLAGSVAPTRGTSPTSVSEDLPVVRGPGPRRGQALYCYYPFT